MDSREFKKRRREKFLILFTTLVLGIALYFEFRLTGLSHQLPFVNSIFFFGLINFNIILLMILILLISRNVSKVFIERRKKALGSNLKSKLVVSFLSFSIVPTIILFLISSLYINSTFDKWFSLKILNTLETSLEITDIYYKNTGRISQFLASNIGREIQKLIEKESEHSFSSIQTTLNQYRESISVDALEYYSAPLGERIVSISPLLKDEFPSEDLPRLPYEVMKEVLSGHSKHLIQHLSGTDLIRAAAPVSRQGLFVVTFRIPVSLVSKVDAISTVFQEYKGVNPLKYPVKTTYFLILIMMTLLIIFVSIWVGIYLARELTVPLDRLVQAMKRVRRGELDFQVASEGQDELSTLIESFNIMTQDLYRNRQELVEKRSYVETILNNISAGVVSVDIHGIVATVNRSALKFLDCEEKDLLGLSLEQFCLSPKGQLHEPLWDLYLKIQSRLDEKPLYQVQYQFAASTDTEPRQILVSASDFGGGVVLVLDDPSFMAKSQREAAWREVARRIAHEIKNPLTPIKLSAQRIQRKLEMKESTDAESKSIQSCIDTIVKNVDELRDMVNEFSEFARFPEAKPNFNDLNSALKEVMVLYQEAHKAHQFTFEFEQRMPQFYFDRDQIKRVLINLLDNAVAASEQVPNPSISVLTHYNDELRMAVIEVFDNGHGIPAAVIPRLFEPYFSTKKNGTGLGLAIVKRIITDHSGFIRVQSKMSGPTQGTRFYIELPTDLVPS